MPRRRIRVPALDLRGLAVELELPDRFPEDVVAAAAIAARRPRLAPADHTGIPLATVDPPGSRDLDQAFHLAPRPAGGWVVHYAIADVAAFVAAGDLVDLEARRRGETLYLPDRRAPLHPPVLGERAMSLLPGRDRPAILWRIEVDGDGAAVDIDVRRAVVRSRAQLDYPTLQGQIDRGTATEPVRLLAELGKVRQARAEEAGAIDLGLPEQEVVRGPDGHWTLALRAQQPVERWNAHLSLLTGMAAATLMLGAGVGLLRTLPRPHEASVARLQRAARGLGVDWPDGVPLSRVLHQVDQERPQHAAFVDLAAELLRGAGYTAFDGEPPALAEHAGVGGPYAHVTAPIRRLADRFAGEVCVAVAAGRPVPSWARSALAELPDVMARTDRRAAAVEHAVVGLAEAWLLVGRIGEVFDAAVVDVDPEHGGRRGTVVLADPAVRARCDGDDLPLGERIRARLVTADIATRTVRFEAC
ncbi:MAG: RNB domain-containing ribonuclease [Actinobacteria bacterium]|nr:RNB domain-containing ribonuclease [Actinomycetota bacterium]